ncbi:MULTISPECIES: adenylate/guanylate cyclase domain-containing protein [Paraburkholderia]|uniref:AAA family ATPase n=1 Tax=Paraburkholderia madseniana TaxID=2599607 RepID=A0AAP5BHZ1_9BURK|nr:MULTISPECIES: adenylate/guanylate cyclase domain-containing protein [Paraburkholderia]MCX4150086.1 AAA family ATPase [Paraburkholderia madseniana]MDN7153021.1 AAA family ATPase [Paraburkholderia sp. WS6]MDQ6411903.1 AAA family ATPase [Paraburkholderia madseniana]
MDVAAWLRSLGMERYEPAFRKNAIDGDVLPNLTADDLKELGITSVGHRRKLLDALAGLRAREDPEHAAVGLSQAEGERRQVAVLFADLCGFTQMSRELDPEEVLAVLDRYFEQADRCIEQHGGHVDKHVGDCAMAVFGAPLSHGNDAERAVRAALAIGDAMPGLSRTLARSISVHIGIAGGQVVASGTGSVTHREYTVTGETVNLASRLTDAAGPGEILISEAVWRPLADRLDCAERGALAVKGFAQAVPVWCLGALRRSPQSRPFVGRASELRQFRAVLASCRETGRGHIVYVRGEAGIGKTRLLEEFQCDARDKGFACHGGLVLDFGSRTGRDAVQSLVRGILALDDANDENAGMTAVVRAIKDGLIDADDALFLNDLVDVPQAVHQRAVYDAMDNATRVRGRRNVLTRLVERASRLRPRVLAVEDIHWSDGSMLDDLAGLAATVAQCPAILVLTSRTEGDPLDQPWCAAAGAAYSIFDLGPLHIGEARLLAESFAGAEGDFAEHCIERAAGNPLFLEQLLRNAGETAGNGVPGSVQSLVQARLDRLDPTDKAVLQAASVLGQLFEKEAVAHLHGSADAALERLVMDLLLRPQGNGFIFHHALIRDAVYDGLLKSRRRELHRRAAQWYGDRDPVLRAEHLDRAADPGAARAYCDAARSQAAGYRNEFALRLVDRGLELAATRTDRFALECLRGDILHDLGDMMSALGAFASALRVAAADAERCQAWIGLATVKRVTDDLDGAWADLDCAAATAIMEGLLCEEARIHFLRGNLCFPRGDIEGCVREHGRSLALAREVEDHEQEAAALGGLGDGEYMRGRMMSAHDAFSRCIDLCQCHGFGRIEVANLPMRAITAWFAGETRDGLDAALASVAAAEKVGHRRALVVAHHAAYHCLHDLAEWDRAWEHVGPALQHARELKARRFEGEALAFRAELHRVAGRQREALNDIGEALAISRETGMAYLGASYFGVLARATDDVVVFEMALAEGEATLAAGAVSHNHYLFRRDAIDACLDRGLWDAAAAHAAALEDYASREPSPFSGFVVARARALLSYGMGNRDVALMTELQRLKEEGQRFGFLHALPAIDAAVLGRANNPE